MVTHLVLILLGSYNTVKSSDVSEVKLTSLYVCVFFLLLQIDSQHYVRSKMDQLGLSWDVDKK